MSIRQVLPNSAIRYGANAQASKQEGNRMRRRGSHLAAVITTLSTLLLAAACSSTDGSSGQGTNSKSGSTLRIGWGATVLTLDPPNESAIGGIGVLHNVYQTLVGYDFSAAKAVPELASSWTISSDAKTYTFKLDSRAKFANGDPVTASDVVWSLDRVTSWSAAVQGYQLAGLAGGKVTATDPETVTISLAKPSVVLLSALSGTAASVIDQKQVEKAAGSSVDAQRAWLKEHTAGSGRYTVSQWTPGNSIVLARNDNFWDGTPEYKSVQIQQISESSQEVSQLQQGDLDVALDTTPQQKQQLSSSGFVTQGSEDPATYYVAMNESIKPFDNPLVREAVKYAIDYEGIINGLFGGQAVKAGGIIASSLLGYDPSLNDLYTTDPAKAKSLLTQAGYPHGFTMDLYAATDTVKDLGVPTKTLATKLQSDLGAVGIKVNLKIEDINTLFPQYQKGNLPALVWYFGPTYPDPDPIVSPHGALDTAATKRVAFNDPALSNQIIAARTMTDTAARKAAYVAIGKTISEDGPYAFMFRPKGSAVLRKGTSGFTWVPIWSFELK